MHLSARASKRCHYNARMLAIVLSTIAFFVAGYFLKRYLDDSGIPKTMVRGMVVFVLALAAAYGVAFVVDRVADLL
jgi:membrane protein DedA with SNARE-associated domain